MDDVLAPPEDSPEVGQGALPGAVQGALPGAVPRTPGSRSPLLAALLGWAIPGLGQVYTGRPGKGLLYFVAIFGTFLLGLALTDFSAIDPQKHPLDFAAQVFAGGPTLAARELTRNHALTALPRWIETGRLYVLVAGLLNLVAMTDAVGEAILRSRTALAWLEERRLRASRALDAEEGQ